MGNENSTPVGQKSSTSLRATRERRTNEEIQEEDAATLQRDVDMSRREILLRTLQCQANNCNEEEGITNRSSSVCCVKCYHC